MLKFFVSFFKKLTLCTVIQQFIFTSTTNPTSRKLLDVLYLSRWMIPQQSKIKYSWESVYMYVCILLTLLKVWITPPKRICVFFFISVVFINLSGILQEINTSLLNWTKWKHYTYDKILATGIKAKVS